MDNKQQTAKVRPWQDYHASELNLYCTSLMQGRFEYKLTYRAQCIHFSW